MIRHSKQLIMQVKELLERNLDAYEIAARMHISADEVRILIDLVNNLFT